MNLFGSLTTVPGIGPSTFLKIQKQGFTSILDLLHLYPLRYEDFSLISQIALLQPGETATITAEVISSQHSFTHKRNLTIQKLQVRDLSDNIELIWFNQPYVLKQFKRGETYLFSGRILQHGKNKSMQVAEYEIASDKPLHTGGIIPYYTGTLGISSKVIRQKITWILNNLLKESVSSDRVLSLTRIKMLSAKDTLRALHFPKNWKELKMAKKRLSFEQLLEIKRAQIVQQNQIRSKKATVLVKTQNHQLNDFCNQLPFTLTPSQKMAIDEIITDFCAESNQQRLLMGDVGSGKTVVMAFAAYFMAKSGYKTAVMAPTEALVQQHFHSFQEWLQPHKIKVSLLTNKTRANNFANSHILIGTQALLFAKLDFERLGLVVVDEQHKFGVLQTQCLTTQSKHQPRIMLVSATPIPRSLALTLYHHTKLSYLKEKPYANQIKTFVVPETKRLSSYQWLNKQLKLSKQQAYLVCPAIETGSGKLNELKTVKQEEQKLSCLLPNIKIKAIYSKHPQKQEILEQFRTGKIDLLITTTLIEVGIDIGTANIMIVENAERFGLSQLHQLRGRIGRRGQKGFFLLFSSLNNDKTQDRLKILEQTNDAEKIAIADLKYRGAGDLLGTAQHGFNYIQTKDLFNAELIVEINRLATKLVANSQDKEYTSLLVNKLV